MKYFDAIIIFSDLLPIAGEHTNQLLTLVLLLLLRSRHRPTDWVRAATGVVLNVHHCRLG
jgi:hypothetical protein